MTRHLLMGLLLVSTMAMAREPVATRLEKRIEDDGKTLSIHLDGFVDGREIRYRQTFAVADMNDLQKEVLKCRVFYAQGLGLPLDEMPGTLLAVPAVAALVIGLLVAGARAVKASLAHS
ncbi:MAG: hypothetical protein ICV83_16370 [Cytophagales bacterium]|nr:hypothetical protein [Cytophagales bacterium]